MTEVSDITRRRGNTRRVSLILKVDKRTFTDLTNWTNFRLVINTEEFPTDTSQMVETIIGSVSNAKKGQVYFSPSGNTPAGDYFYEASCLDGNREIFTFLVGKFIVEQDIIKR